MSYRELSVDDTTIRKLKVGKGGWISAFYGMTREGIEKSPFNPPYTKGEILPFHLRCYAPA
jgi:hypothetical protein